MYGKIQRRREGPLYSPQDERRHCNRDSDPETAAFINQYTSLGDKALREPSGAGKVVSIDYYLDLADTYLSKPRKISN